MRSEKLKLNLLMTLRFSFEYGKGGKIRDFDVPDLGWTLYLLG